MNKIGEGFTKEYLVETLKNGVHEVCFYKVDGTIRTLNCTRSTDIIPEEFTPCGSGIERTTVVPVFDIDDKVWKSFVVENTIYIN